MTTTALSEALAKLRQLKVPNWPAGRILGDIADEIESALASDEPVAPITAGCVHHDFSILDSYIRNLRWSHDATNEIRDAVAANLRGLYTHILLRGLFAGSGSWDAGRLAAAKWIERRRCAFADKYGSVDPATGVLEFGNGYPERDEYYCELSEIEEAIRALPAPQFVAHAKPAAKVEAERFETSPEDRFEQFVQAEIGRSPKPLQELGEYLTRALDEDEFPTANRLLLQLAVEYSTPASVPDGYPLSVSEAKVLIDQHELWIAEADSIGVEYSGNERRLELLRAVELRGGFVITTQSEPTP